jgi:Acetoacetate decarboxylase (ADC)
MLLPVVYLHPWTCRAEPNLALDGQARITEGDRNLQDRSRCAGGRGSEPLEIGEPIVKYDFIRMPDSTGFGDYTESGQVIPVRFRGEDDESAMQGVRRACESKWASDPAEQDSTVANVMCRFRASLMMRAAWSLSKTRNCSGAAARCP